MDAPHFDLATPEGRQAYRRYLRGYMRGWRYLGLALVIGSLVPLAWPRVTGDWMMLGPLPLQHVGWIALALGWMILGAVIVWRSRHHRAMTARQAAMWR